MASLKYKDENGVWQKVSTGGGSSSIPSADKIPVTNTTANKLSLPSGASVDVSLQKLDTVKAPMYTYGMEDLEAGVTALDTGKLHFVYE